MKFENFKLVFDWLLCVSKYLFSICFHVKILLTIKFFYICQNFSHNYRFGANKYEKLKECHYMCHSVQYKEGIFLDPYTHIAILDQRDDDGNIINDEDMKASHHYFVSILIKIFEKLFLIE